MKNLHQARDVRRGTLPIIGRLIGAASALVIAALAASNLQAKEAPEEVSFDVPGAAATYVTDISPKGDIAGFYADNNNAVHAFLLTKEGGLATFDAPQSGDEANFRPSPEAVRLPDAIVSLHDLMVRMPDLMVRLRDLMVRRPLMVRKPEVVREREEERKPEVERGSDLMLRRP